MAYKCREEIVGKRFLSVSGFSKLKSGKISEWGWRSGVVRAATHRDNTNQDLQVLVEYDDVEWHRREWISIYKDGLFHLFMVEQALVWAQRRDPFTPTHGTALWPALTFSALVSIVDIPAHLQPVEFLVDKELAFKDYKLLKPYQEWDTSLPGVKDYPELRLAVKRWTELQDGQRILLTTPSVLVGYRVEVYRAEGTTQWYTAVIIGYNEATRDLTVTDDTVLEEHNEDPALVQMRLIGDGVVESIMRGENVGITPRRSRSSVFVHQTSQAFHHSRVIRGLSSVSCSVNPRKPRSARSGITETGNSPEPPDKGPSGKSRKRKPSETDTPSTTAKSRTSSFSSTKEDCENKQTRRKNLNQRGSNKKKVLEEANNSKLREIEVRVEDCLQSNTALSELCRRKLEESSAEKEEEKSPGQQQPQQPPADAPDPEPIEAGDNGLEDSNGSSSVELVSVDVQSDDATVQCGSMPASEVVNGDLNSEEDCVIVAQRTSTPSKAEERDCCIRGDDDGPLVSSSPYSRMELNSETPTSLLRFPDDRSDSGVSSLRSGSGDERSGSRSSALSSSDEPNHPSSSSSGPAVVQAVPAQNRSPLFIPAPSTSVSAVHQRHDSEPVRVWRDPNLLLEEPHVRHIQSVQHQTLLMSHPSTPASTGQSAPTSASGTHPSSLGAYPVVPPPHSLMTHSLGHPHLPTHGLYHPQFPEMLWKTQRGPYGVGVPAHLLPQQTGPSSAEEMMERERVSLAMQDRERHERLIRERQNQELEKQQKEKERLERDRQEQREKLERERERERQEKERELEKERQEQALHNHFEKSLRAAQQKREHWNSITGRPPQPRTSSLSEEDRKRAEELHQREQQRHLNSVRTDTRDHRSYYPVQRPPSVPGKADYPPPAHSRVVPTSKSEKMPSMSMPQQIPKSELNMYGYPVCQPQNAFFEPKKSDIHKPSSGLGVTKSNQMDREREMSNQALVNDLKTSVIVKHEGKTSHHLEPRVSVTHSPSPKLRSEILGHYLPTPGQTVQSKGMYEYRSPTQSPLHLSHTPTSHHHLEPQNLGKTQSHHRPTGQLPSPHHQRQSPHPHAQPHPSPEMRYPRGSESQAMIYQTTKSYPFATTGYTMSTSPSVSNSKPKVSSPAPPQIFGKPILGGVSVVPVSRPHESTAAIQLTSKPPLSSSVSPSPYQQVSPYHPPHNQTPATMNCPPPPPAHSSRTTSSIDIRYDRTPGYVPGGLPSKLVGQQGTSSPPSATSAPMPMSRSHAQFFLNLSGVSQQTQPLDLGMSSSKFENNPSVSPKRKAATPVSSAGGSNPVCLEVKKRRIEQPPTSTAIPPNLSIFSSVNQQPQLARVSEPSPLIASAATTITTVVNTAAYRTPTTNVTSLTSQSPMALTENLPDVSVTAVTVETIRPASTGDTSPKPPTPTVPLSNSPAPLSSASTPTPPTSVTPGPTVDESPGTPVKVNMSLSVIDSEKSNSPGPQKTSSSSYPLKHLKKAWLQRHTGEDLEDTTGVIGSGSCVTLPINIKTTTTTLSNSTSNPVKDTPVSSLHLVGSMAVNSISKVKQFPSKPINRKPVKESTANGDAKNDDSSSSDQERGRKSPPKRKPPKVKRKKGGGPSSKKPNDEKKRKTGPQPVTPPSESGSDSDKESGSEKDSDSGASASAPSKKSAGAGKEPRKRGRRPKGSKNDKGEEPRPKKVKDDIQPPRDPFRKPPVGQLKKTGESFLQDGPCFEVAPKLAKCRECRWTPNQRSKNMPNIFCRFYAFRRLRYTKNGQLAIAGFSDPHKDALEDDLKLWLPNAENPPPDLDLETSRFLLKQVGDHFCDLLIQEKEAHAEHMCEDKIVAWKRVVQGVREMCDVCETTLFNFHWACGKCGFVVCIDCYKSRKKGAIKVWGEPGKDRDEYSWLLCTNRQAHEQEKLMLTQIIAGESLLKLGKMVHEMRELWNIEQYCACPASKEISLKPNNMQAKEIIKSILGDKVNGIKKEIKDEDDVMLDRDDKKEGSSSEEEGNFSTLRELLIRPSHKPNGSRAASPVTKTENKKKTPIPTKPADLDDVISSVIEDSVPQKTVETVTEPKQELKHFIRRYNWHGKGRVQLPIRIMTLTESKMLYPDTPHSWLCDGKLLRLSDPMCKGNQKIFQDQWKRGQPVIVSDVTRNINSDLWHPDAFARDFGDEKNDLVNCMTGNLVPNQPMRKFWEGFDHFSKRLKDDRGQPMLLKLKDWPPGEDFAEMLPSRYSDLMKVLPLSEYTHRTGRLNLASRLPDCFVRPDLGPKMYNAYGSALHPNKGTTNLHLDISDAVNVMVYVGIPKDGDSDEHIKEAFRAIDEAGCDILTRRRVRDKGELPGALWHIYNARDADKIRDLLNKVVVEKGGRLEPHHDPIHDQSCYLDGPLRERLYKEYGVEGYAIVQCKGDAVFIPAGAPHQVRNLHNCIKVAEDFVSPENVSHCFHLTQEFRDLSDTHSNHEDKLQIKNIIYHAVKDSLSTLSAIMNKHLNVKSEKDSGSERSNGSAAVDAENSTKSDSNETA